ncbi:hypothetical protein PSECIP111951_00121 [Pseudoalteromonas holothuriae]|uniref:Uncharacterized protein n=1 Tax=Pseudoalteromonas holothuriae TaxID=2963714 RepID=A0A9W4VSL9_9GAMM|nr:MULTISPECIES: hypothetical protein [unclassified Pseudoalteromonas]CAH9050104.1 hypothetical protein PSECIP111951_00121 [Pseudoalteromonas sp. CIP111951]CAH9052578.1 hypothetical protein PSECIP111854_00998 [Pseudoalteromonas sp. CIP111854]
MHSLFMSLFFVLALTSCKTMVDDKSGKPTQLVNANQPLQWFIDNSVEQVIAAHEKAQTFGLIALNRRGHFYPKIGMSKGPLILKSGCQTWLVSASNDVVSNESEREKMASLQGFAAKFNMSMESRCLP